MANLVGIAIKFWPLEFRNWGQGHRNRLNLLPREFCNDFCRSPFESFQSESLGLVTLTVKIISAKHEEDGCWFFLNNISVDSFQSIDRGMPPNPGIHNLHGWVHGFKIFCNDIRIAGMRTPMERGHQGVTKEGNSPAFELCQFFTGRKFLGE